jgi:hypothetical protein
VANLGRKNLGKKKAFRGPGQLVSLPTGILKQLRDSNGRPTQAFRAAGGRNDDDELVLGVPIPETSINGGTLDEELTGCGNLTTTKLLVQEAELKGIKPSQISWYVLRG